MNLYATFRRINLICLYALAGLLIVWFAGGLGLTTADILFVAGMSTAGVVYHQLFKVYRKMTKKETET